ncbi:hypothetical protein V6N11_018774 [Hibiscus sabdariffa]|uniref:Retrotransposon protein n=1 Tax=Hibiscus sabdariffa TaxID=183260 RepID=A0ABR2QTE5_9ROSI
MEHCAYQGGGYMRWAATTLPCRASFLHVEPFRFQMANNTISLRSLLEKEKLNGINFLDWFRNLRIVLKQEMKEYVIEEAVLNDPGPNASRADKDKFKKHMDDMVDVGCLMLATMTPELQKQHENMVA